MKIKFVFFVLAFIGLTVETVSAQYAEEKRIKMEITVKEGNKQVIAAARSFTVSFNRASAPVKDTANKNAVAETSRGHYLSIDFEKQDLPLLRAFIQNKGGLDGQLIATDSYGKLPGRKIEFKSAVLETMNDQMTGDYGSAFMTLACEELIIDGVKLAY
ncbi:hypothetical protein [Chitinophaga nivalis]|uniref:Uncharacterized protein n=1 Tax=Chitinophaga nivalis TaxID=2991709 RepID=A0ABT3IJL8_9BACT|nr:hypothetical protein [Chitinophaga nivalis]MCW3466171.1 hypothetical protein [Chitinophaga nivalis]MCW3484138.1 hypothetical protein [Chitinophaga nivalis]